MIQAARVQGNDAKMGRFSSISHHSSMNAKGSSDESSILFDAGNAERRNKSQFRDGGGDRYHDGS